MHKKNLKKNKTKKTIKKKKPKLSEEYLNSEIETSNLLERQFKDTTTKSLEVTLEAEIDFFTNTLKQIKLSSSTSSSQSGSIKDNENVVEEAHSPVAKSDTQPLSSYIQIDDIINPVYSVGKLKIFFEDDELLYKPSSDDKTDHFCDTKDESMPDDGILYQYNNFKKSKNMNRMVNRFKEEGNLEVLTASGILKNLKNFTPDSILYKTEIEYKKIKSYSSDLSTKMFEPIYVLNKLYEIPYQQIESKKLLSFVVKELKFGQHPLQTEEHHLSNKLESLFETYQEITSHNLLSKLNLELTNIRNIIKDYMDDPQAEDLENIERLMTQSKQLRKKLHREELALKTVVENCLETWKQLKNCRKHQQFNYTDIKLIIKVQEIQDVREDEIEWNNRYQIELAEVLREEFEKFYKTKRNKKSKEMNTKTIHKPDVEIIKMDVKEILKNCTRLPGEPKIQLDYHRLEDRCKNLSKFTDYYFEIFFDNTLVGTSKIFKLESNFNIQIEQSFGVYLEKKIPKDIKIKMFEKSKMGTGKKIALIQVPLHNTIDYSSGHCEIVEFSSLSDPKICGSIKMIIYFDTNVTFAVEDKKNKPYNQSKISEQVLKNWYNDKLINPLNPDCLSLIKNFDENSHTNNPSLKSDETLTFNEELLTFCSNEVLQNDERLKWLKSRHQNDIKYKDLKFVPLLNNEFEEQTDIHVLEQGDWISLIDIHKHKGKSYLINLYDVILNHSNQLNKKDEASNILIGDDIPTLRSFITNIGDLIFGRRKSLNPPKSTLLPLSSVQSGQLQSFNIIVNVIRATGVPVRNFSLNTPGDDSNDSINGRNIKYGNIRPFINLSYKDKSLRTATADGSNPTWNEQLVLKLNGFNLQQCNDDLKFQIFDEYIEDLIQDDNDGIGIRSMEVYQRIHTNYLGEYRIPISTIFNNCRVEGVFELNNPKVIVGYIKPSLDPQTVNTTTIPIENNFEIRDSIYLWLFISIEPQFEFPPMQTNFLECAELKEVKMHIYQEWVLPIKELYPGKFFDPLICLETGKRVCVTRLLESIVIPFEDSENLENCILRYVSLIPVIKSSSSCLSLKGVWLKNQTVLDTTWASAKDLGVLLACFYLNLGIKCWLILGISYPCGDSAYVLIQENGSHILIDPVKGKKYFTKDVNCPLILIYCAVGQENIYCNIQRENRISLLDFNLNDSSLWLPLFNSKNPAPIGGVHKLDYEFKNLYNTSDLKKIIERKIVKKINTWRSTRKTIWNRAFHHILYDILVDLEQDLLYDRVSDNYLERISMEFPNYKIFGFTLNFPYTNLSSISDRVRSTLIHSNTDPTVEFSVACYLHQYPNNIISCWIFLITATPIL